MLSYPYLQLTGDARPLFTNTYRDGRIEAPLLKIVSPMALWRQEDATGNLPRVPCMRHKHADDMFIHVQKRMTTDHKHSNGVPTSQKYLRTASFWNIDGQVFKSRWMYRSPFSRTLYPTTPTARGLSYRTTGHACRDGPVPDFMSISLP